MTTPCADETKLITRDDYLDICKINPTSMIALLLTSATCKMCQPVKDVLKQLVEDGWVFHLFLFDSSISSNLREMFQVAKYPTLILVLPENTPQETLEECDKARQLEDDDEQPRITLVYPGTTPREVQQLMHRFTHRQLPPGSFSEPDF